MSVVILPSGWFFGRSPKILSAVYLAPQGPSRPSSPRPFPRTTRPSSSTPPPAREVCHLDTWNLRQYGRALFSFRSMRHVRCDGSTTLPNELIPRKSALLTVKVLNIRTLFCEISMNGRVTDWFGLSSARDFMFRH